MHKLFESSRRNCAVVLDKKKIIYTDPSRVRKINHLGKHYTVPGRHIRQPSPRRTPVLAQAETSKSGQTFAAGNAEVVFVAGHSPSVAPASFAATRAQAKEFGRDPNNIKFIALLTPIIATTHEAAATMYLEYASYGSINGALVLRWMNRDRSG